MNDYEKDWWTTEAMIRFGGSFVKGLGNLWRLADTTNRSKLEQAFLNYFEVYKSQGEMLRKDNGV